MRLREAFERVHTGGQLTREESRAVFEAALSQEPDAVQLAAFLVGLAGRGESAEEILGAAEALRGKALPFEHDESMPSQRRALGLLEALKDETEAARAPHDEPSASVAEFAAGALDSAREHAEIVSRFGRYPYRNEVLGRASTAEERAWLEGGARRFGQ